MQRAVRLICLLSLGVGLFQEIWANPLPEHYTYDPTYNAGVVLDDSFAAAGQHFAERSAALSDGSVVVVGLVPGNGQSASTIGGNIGVVHYTSDGRRVAWSDPTLAFASYLNIYLTYPQTATANYVHIDDVKVNGSNIYILADKATSATNHDVDIIVFTSSGNFVGQYSAFGTALDERGAGLAIYSYVSGNSPDGVVTSTQLVAVASYNAQSAPNQDYIVTMRSFDVSTNGFLAVNTSFGTSGNGAMDQPLPESFCSTGPNKCSGAATAVAALRTTTSTPTLYILGAAPTYFQNPQGESAFVMAVDGSTGDLESGFGSNGIFGIPIDIIDGTPTGANNSEDETIGLVARATTASMSGDSIFLATASDSATGCHTFGAEITKLYNQPENILYETVVDASWGSSGHSYVCKLGAGKALAADSSHLVLTGGSESAPFISTVSISDGELLGANTVPWLRADGETWDEGQTPPTTTDGGFVSVVPVSDGVYIVSGTLCDATRGTACPAFGTTRLISDSIFGDGFD